MIPSLGANARDVTFEFNNSCNCCGVLRRKNMKDCEVVYVNHNGEVEKFKKKKGDVDSYATSNLRIKSIIDQLAMEAEQEVSGASSLFVSSIKQKLRVNLEDAAEAKLPVTVEFVKRVNTAVKETFNIIDGMKRSHLEVSTPSSLNSSMSDSIQSVIIHEDEEHGLPPGFELPLTPGPETKSQEATKGSFWNWLMFPFTWLMSWFR